MDNKAILVGVSLNKLSENEKGVTHNVLKTLGHWIGTGDNSYKLLFIFTNNEVIR